MKKHSARVAPLSACNSPVLTLTKVEGNAWRGGGDLRPRGVARSPRPAQGAASAPGAPCSAAACGGGTWQLPGAPGCCGPGDCAGCCGRRGSLLRGPGTSALWVGGGHPSAPRCPPRSRLCPLVRSPPAQATRRCRSAWWRRERRRGDVPRALSLPGPPATRLAGAPASRAGERRAVGPRAGDAVRPCSGLGGRDQGKEGGAPRSPQTQLSCREWRGPGFRMRGRGRKGTHLSPELLLWEGGEAEAARLAR